MAVVPMPNGPTVRANVPQFQTDGQVQIPQTGLMEGKVIDQMSAAQSNFQKSVNEAYVRGSDIRTQTRLNEFQEKLRNVQREALLREKTQVTEKIKGQSFLEYYEQESKKLFDEAGKGLDGYQSQLFKEKSRETIQRYQDSLISHNIKQIRAVEVEQFTVSANTAADLITEGIDDLNNVKSRTAEIYTYLGKIYQGATDEFITQKTQEIVSKSLSRGIGIVLDQGETKKASDLMDYYRTRMNPEDKRVLEKAIHTAKRKDTVRSEIEKIITTKDITEAEALHKANSIEDPEIREDVFAGVTKHYHNEHAIAVAVNNQNMKTAIDLLNDGRDVPATLLETIRDKDPEGYRRLTKAMNNPNVYAETTNGDVYRQLASMAIEDPAGFADVPLFKYIGELEKPDYENLVKRQKNMATSELNNFIGHVEAKARKKFPADPVKQMTYSRAAYRQWHLASQYTKNGVVNRETMEQMVNDLFINDVQSGWGSVTAAEYFQGQSDLYVRGANGITSSDADFGDLNILNTRPIQKFIAGKYGIEPQNQTREMISYISQRSAGRPIPGDLANKAIKTLQKAWNERPELRTAYPNGITNELIELEVEKMLKLIK